VPREYLDKYFDRRGEGYQIHSDVKELVRFCHHNLKHDSGLRDLDVIFCRNVLIYFDEAAQQATVQRFWNALASPSFLVIGHSESLFGMKTSFEFLRTDWACIYQKTAGERM
jgi:chemotaxis protein methyltransferase CheR